jgi:hypothetical protein
VLNALADRESPNDLFPDPMAKQIQTMLGLATA